MVPSNVLVIGGAAAFGVIVVWLHARRHDIDPATKGVSHYATGPTHRLMTIAFVALAIGVAASVIRIQAMANGANAPGIVLLLVAAVGIAVVAAVPVAGPADARWRSATHTLAALLFFVAIAAGAVMVSSGAASGAAWLLLAATGVFLVSMAGVPGLLPVRGWLQRTCFALIVAWLLIVGLSP
jgi:hypothetical protein